MDFEAALAKESPIREQARAATFFRSLCVDGEKHLALLFAAMNRVDLTRRELDKHETVLIGLGAISIASTLNRVGFNPTSSVHAEMAQWILRNTSSPNIEVSAYCINALGEFRTNNSSFVPTFCELTQAVRRQDESERITLRAIAFRMLSRISQATALKYVGSDACKEYLAAVELWIAESPHCRDSLEMEVAWIQANQS